MLCLHFIGAANLLERNRQVAKIKTPKNQSWFLLLFLFLILVFPLFLLQIGFFDDKVGPVTVALVVEIALLVIMFSALKDVLFG